MADQTSIASALGRARFYDLSQPITAGCPGWPTYPPTVLETVCTTARDGFNAERLEIITHTATHLDVPYHFFDEGRRLHEVPAEEFQGPAAVLDLRPLAPSQGIGPSDLERAGKHLQPGDIAILCTGWGEKRSHEKVFMYEWPYLTGDGAAWLIDHGVRAVAIDALSVGGWAPGTGRPCHEALLGAGRWILEDIRVPEEVVSAGRCYLFSFPVLIEGSGGSLVRAVAAVG